MYYHLILTERCNAKCKYCYEKSLNEFDNGLDKKWDFDFNCPTDIKVDINLLKNFFSKDKDPMIVFYGGEPLMNLKEILNVMDNIPARYGLQTNGKLLPSIPENYVKKLSKVLVSIDGNEERTDYNRGKRNYFLSLKGIDSLRKKGFNGEIVARMTISFPDIYEQVTHIFSLINEGYFDSVYWQLDAGFYKNDFDFDKYKIFVENYNNSLTMLIEYWFEELKKGNVLKVYPFIGIVDSLLKNEETRLRCGSGYANYTITTSGEIVACPIMNSVKTFSCGDLSCDPKQLKEFNVTEPCLSCDYLKICGGRCLYSSHAKLWPSEGEELICKTVIHLINELKLKMPLIRDLIKRNIISEKDFEYEKYFGPEIIP